MHSPSTAKRRRRLCCYAAHSCCLQFVGWCVHDWYLRVCVCVCVCVCHILVNTFFFSPRTDQLTKFTAIYWINEFLALAKVSCFCHVQNFFFTLFFIHIISVCFSFLFFFFFFSSNDYLQRKMLPFMADLLGAILPSLAADSDVKIRCES